MHAVFTFVCSLSLTTYLKPIFSKFNDMSCTSKLFVERDQEERATAGLQQGMKADIKMPSLTAHRQDSSPASFHFNYPCVEHLCVKHFYDFSYTVEPHNPNKNTSVFKPSQCKLTSKTRTTL